MTESSGNRLFLSFICQMQASLDSGFMKRALELAARGSGHVAPNPLVGCVLVRHGEIIGEGYHALFGGPHAEVNAIASVENPELLRESTLYVTLEPCAHYGKTPPCANLIIQKGIPRVVIGCRDPFLEVNGKGMDLLRNAGIEVISDVLHEECRDLNRRFFTLHEKKRPYVILKWAQSADGYMDVDRASNIRGSVMISHPDTQVLVHRWRSEEASILIGKNTLINDDPSLTVRRVEGKNPLRVVLSSEAMELSSFKLGNSEAPTLVLTNDTEKLSGNTRYAACGNVHDVASILRRLHTDGVLSVLVEGGAQTLKSFLQSGLWDEARIITSNRKLGNGLLAPTHAFSPWHEEKMATDTIRYYVNKS
jgi:diaminohydroxyphosphoribosylaminopyrimidine deaminase/5-amino-6-(5-phosphoribosylamino)uracil reductase